MLPDSALKSMNVLIATPCYISAVSMNYVTSLFNFVHAANHWGMACTLHMHSESLITRGRNEIVSFFLRHEEYTHLMWIDSDISFLPAHVFRLLLSDHDVAAGIYPIKSLNWPDEGLRQGMTQEQFVLENGTFPFNPLGHWDEHVLPHLTEDNFIEVAEAPTGFMAIKRHVFTELIRNYPNLNYMPEGAEKRANAAYYWLFFDCMVEPGSNRYLSEDYAFCKRWRDIGGKVYADFQSDLGHLGQYMYTGNLAEKIYSREGRPGAA